MTDWNPIETASAVGKKRLMFCLASGRVVFGYRLALTRNVMIEGGSKPALATHWANLPSPPEAAE